MNVKLTTYSESLLRKYLGQGGYRTPEEVIERALESLAQQESSPESGTSILQLQGLGKESWRGVDAQTYVEQERAAWNG